MLTLTSCESQPAVLVSRLSEPGVLRCFLRATSIHWEIGQHTCSSPVRYMVKRFLVRILRIVSAKALASPIASSGWLPDSILGGNSETDNLLVLLRCPFRRI